jgi:nicotinate-nucleotide adenylyltransferase
MCKELTRKAQKALAARYSALGPGMSLTSALMADKVVHGPAAAVLLAEDYGVADEGLLEAVAAHTIGKPGMGGLAAVLYCADKLEPGRERLVEGYRDQCLALPLDGMVVAVVEGVIGWMSAQGKAVAPETLILYSSLVREAD